ncbi:hypothetical protein IQ235_13080 [Oscillatoriales cyanobacterium LEGE 11467]|uniref:Uncharacterized protein n=1 Tax=Zarconia navalis LEGE 11467 TaxID=1828826 RepID=A0A928VWV4_9CYAN|nr:hypothetical protein [Zarconia navalis]MBE9041712.1 hypothetical protein [Zarconia navalis LEGE 11467]
MTGVGELPTFKYLILEDEVLVGNGGYSLKLRRNTYAAITHPTTTTWCPNWYGDGYTSNKRSRAGFD